MYSALLNWNLSRKLKFWWGMWKFCPSTSGCFLIKETICSKLWIKPCFCVFLTSSIKLKDTFIFFDVKEKRVGSLQKTSTESCSTHFQRAYTNATIQLSLYLWIEGHKRTNNKFNCLFQVEPKKRQPGYFILSPHCPFKLFLRTSMNPFISDSFYVSLFVLLVNIHFVMFFKKRTNS